MTEVLKCDGCLELITDDRFREVQLNISSPNVGDKDHDITLHVHAGTPGSIRCRDVVIDMIQAFATQHLPVRSKGKK